MTSNWDIKFGHFEEPRRSICHRIVTPPTPIERSHRLTEALLHTPRREEAQLRRPTIDLDAVVEGVDADGSGLIDARDGGAGCGGDEG